MVVRDAVHTKPSAWFLVAPLLAAAFLSVAGVALVQGAVQRDRLEPVVALVLVPAVLAALAAPGYIYGVLAHRRWRTIGRLVTIWIWASLVVGVLAAAGALVASIPTGLGPVLSLWSLVMAVRLLLMFRRRNVVKP
jgi:hypothetical protein